MNLAANHLTDGIIQFVSIKSEKNVLLRSENEFLLLQVDHKSNRLELGLHSRANPAQFYPIKSRDICFHFYGNLETSFSTPAKFPRVPRDCRDLYARAALYSA